ncbi:hypothetical protein LguiB_007130 [Lonicera macranthoides]
MAEVIVEREGVETDKLSVFRDEGPSFYKIIVSGLNTEELRIPPHFVRHIKKDESDSVTLKGPSGGHWRVKLAQKENSTILQEGLKEFIRDNSIGEANCLLFTYEGNLCFNVQVFDKCGLERINTSKQLEATSSGVTKKQAGRPRKGSIDHSPKEQQSRVSSTDLNYVLDWTADGKQPEAEAEAEASNGKGKRGRPAKCNSSPLNLHLPESSRDDPGGIKHQQAGPSTGERKPGRPRKDKVVPMKLSELEPSRHSSGDQTEERAWTIWEANSLPKWFEEEKDAPREREQNKMDKRHEQSRTCPPNEEEVARAWERSKSYTPNFPHYRCCLDEFHVKKFILPISEPFPRTHFPPFEGAIVLRNSKGEGWQVNVSERPSFSGGWCSFVLDNNLKQGDVCIFELAHKNEMQVHIFSCSPLDDISLVPRLR